MRDATNVVQSIEFDSTNGVERPVDIPEGECAPTHGWPLGTQPMSVAWDDDDVQVRIDSNTWHRQAAGLPETACGLKIDYRRTLGLRGSGYLGTLCRDGCFSQHELDVIAPRLTAQHEREQAERIDKIVDGAHQTVIDGETRRRKKDP